jgi:hypothetical protein
MQSRCRSVTALAVTAGMLLAACGGGGGGGNAKGPNSTTTTTTNSKDAFVAQVASYELVANQDQRFLAALAGNGTGLVVGFGTTHLDFYYLGTREKPVEPTTPVSGATAAFLPVAGQKVDPSTPGPKAIKPSEGLGVYVAEPVRFADAGFWGVTVNAKIDGRDVSANASFEVYGEPQLPFPGQPAPRTQNPLAGDASVPAEAVDSRATGGSPVPDPELHSTSVASAIAAGRPVMIVVSTPVYCVSRFCGPITDTVSELAKKYGDRMAFVHIEVWQDFQAKKVNPSAEDWIKPKSGAGDMQEPWVYTVDAKGLVRDRFDNVVNGAVLEAAITRLLA